MNKVNNFKKALIGAGTVAVATMVISAQPAKAAGPLDDLANAGTSISTLVTTIGGASVVAVGISAGVGLFRRATGR